MDDDNKSFEAETPVGKFRVRGYDPIQIMMLFALAFMMWLGWYTSEKVLIQINDIGEKLSASYLDAATNAKESSRAIREMTCVLSLDQNKRMDQIGRPDSYCKRMSQ